MQMEVDDLILLLSAELQSVAKLLNLGLESLNLIFFLTEASLKVFLKGPLQILFDIWTIGFARGLPLCQQPVNDVGGWPTLRRRRFVVRLGERNWV